MKIQLEIELELKVIKYFSSVKADCEIFLGSNYLHSTSILYN